MTAVNIESASRGPNSPIMIGSKTVIFSPVVSQPERMEFLALTRQKLTVVKQAECAGYAFTESLALFTNTTKTRMTCNSASNSGSGLVENCVES